ncbi:exodeoxyribonuclease V subunit gamma [Oceanisphaera psychrotolerans]|uniref:RecBCD enzyme subunit RecC n=1 Tax=Oceanisphaera psychrotolerans TaxID=1414654 RepID=A0A1J4QC23_9GAMM|nr:exodeoxyribonuclease V subunit gamma [Oceanisphaera psychrotolerans]OIN04539.1 exodeoxyribonuclease V subunit gamma [Oceanisphaera psychrotolerans]
MQKNDALTPGLMVVHGNHLEALRELAVAWMRRNPLAPLENEVILVQSNGIAQWLKLALAEHRSGGIAAAMQVDLPARFLWQTYRAVLGSHSIPLQSPLDKAPLTWRLMRLLPALLADERFAPLRRFLQDDDDCRKRYQLAERLADLFDQYQVYRADWLAEWAAGRDRIISGRRGPVPLDEAVLWQPALWRALLEDVGHEQLAGSRAGVHPRFVAHLRECEQVPAGLPRRVIVFGISSLPAQTLEALAALARFTQVLLCVHNPCQHHWGDIVPDQDLLRHRYRRHARKPGQPLELTDNDLHQHAHPLLAAWGKQGRDYINLLDSVDDPDHYKARFDAIGSRIDLFGEGDVNHLLGQLQDDMLNLRPLSETREQWPPLTEDTASIRFHVAHSAQREVEILHDQLLDYFSADPGLRPRDIIVMVPDVNVYAPHIQAVFGQYGREDDRYIPFTLADQGSRGTEPLLIALEQLLRLPDNRQTVSEILDLLEVPALRDRFGINEQDVPTLHRWIEGAGVRWGLDARRRAALGLPAELEQNTWRFGLRRMLLGYAVGSGDACQGIEPFDEIGGLDAALIGPLVRLLDTLDALHRQLSQPHLPAEWGQLLHGLLASCFLPANDRDRTLLSGLTEALEHWQELCTGVNLDEPLPLNVVREAWLGALDQGSLSQRFLAGAVNFCTLMPMRAIPFRLVCLLGMNDGDYPRSVTPLDFDLMAGDYRPGDRSRREDDRYLLLEALLSARERLYISWVGRSIRDNSERPPSVLVGQLRDHLAGGWTMDDGRELLAAITTEHPLQPFSKAYFGDEGPLFSYAREWAGLHRSQMPRHEAALPPLEFDEAQPLERLQHFLRDPVGHFFTQRLKVYLDEETPPQLDEEPFGLDGLQLYQLKRQLLEQASQSTEDPELALVQEAGRLEGQGLLPLAGFGVRQREQLLAPLPDQLRRYQALCRQWPMPLESPLPLRFSHGGIALEGWLGGLHRAGERLARIELQPGTLMNKKTFKWHRLLRPFVTQVAAAAVGIELTTLLVGEDETLLFLPLPQSHAERILQGWLEAWRLGLEAPLPVALNTAMVWLEQQDEEKARKAYEGDDYQFAGECRQNAALSRQYPTFAALNASGDFADWSARLYQPLLEHQPELLETDQ